MYSGDAKIADLVEERLQIKEKTRMEGGGEKQGSRREMERRKQYAPSSSQICFLRGEIYGRLLLSGKGKNS